MAILASDIKFLKSERMTDLPDGGGLPTANEVLDNVDNNVFPDISSGDHVTGYTELRVIYGGVRSADTDTLYSGRVYIASPPAEIGVKPFIFPADFGDSRVDLLDVLYRDKQKGANSNYRLYTTYGAGVNKIVLYSCWTNQSAIPSLTPVVGGSYVLEDSVNNAIQFISVVDVFSVWLLNNGVNVTRIHLTLSEPLTAEFRGAFYTDVEHTDYVTPTQLYLTRSDPIPVYGIDTVAVEAAPSDTSISVSNNSVALSSIMNVINNAMGIYAGLIGNSVRFVQVTTAGAGKTQVLPVSGDYTYLNGVDYLKDGVWKKSDNFGTETENFIAVLPEIPDAGSDVVYYTYASAPITTLTALTFRLRNDLVPGSLLLIGANAAGTAVSAVDDEAGGWTGASVSSGSIDYTTGLVEVVMASACYPKDIMIEYQYTTIAESGLDVGIDLIRLPDSKTAPIFRKGDSALIHHSTSENIANPAVAETTYTLSRANVDQIWLESADGTRIPTAKYTVNLTAGSVTMAAGLDLTGYQQPLKAYTTLQDEAVIVGVSGTTLQLSRALTHTYPADTSYVSSIMQLGDLFASVTVPFAQQAWTVWSDTLIGSAITPQFDDVLYPIVVTNDGAITERWRIQFTGTTTVHVIGENVGQIATSVSITSDIAPINPHTSQPYFTIPNEGWGAGWVNGNLLRFNTRSADAALGCGRSIQPGAHTPSSSDRFRLTLLGDVDA
jgi:hypothetical protein